MLAFSDTFWENSTEAEVYQMMSPPRRSSCSGSAWKWWESHDQKPTVGPLLLALHIMWLSVGLHLGVGVMGGAAARARHDGGGRKVGMLFLMPFLAYCACPRDSEKMAGAILMPP